MPQALEQSLGRQVWAIAYPFGDPGSVGAREFKLAEEAGYDCGFVNVGGVLDTVIVQIRASARPCYGGDVAAGV